MRFRDVDSIGREPTRSKTFGLPREASAGQCSLLPMHYREFRPHMRLREFVKCFWTLRHDYSQSVHSEEQLPPKGEIELIFHYGHPFILRDGEDWVKRRITMHERR